MRMGLDLLLRVDTSPGQDASVGIPYRTRALARCGWYRGAYGSVQGPAKHAASTADVLTLAALALPPIFPSSVSRCLRPSLASAAAVSLALQV